MDGQMDGQTDRRTDRIAISVLRVSVLTRDKNENVKAGTNSYTSDPIRRTRRGSDRNRTTKVTSGGIFFLRVISGGMSPGGYIRLPHVGVRKIEW